MPNEAIAKKKQKSKYINGINFSSARRRLKDILEDDFIYFELKEFDINGFKEEIPVLILNNPNENKTTVDVYEKMLGKILVYEPVLVEY